VASVGSGLPARLWPSRRHRDDLVSALAAVVDDGGTLTETS
jgi:hypothetical protein